jgi:hypothetical protein
MREQAGGIKHQTPLTPALSRWEREEKRRLPHFTRPPIGGMGLAAAKN